MPKRRKWNFKNKIKTIIFCFINLKFVIFFVLLFLWFDFQTEDNSKKIKLKKYVEVPEENLYSKIYVSL